MMTAAEMIDDGRILLDLPLKGTRTYLHSTNILSELISRFSLSGPVKLEFRQMIYHPIYLLEGAQDAPNRAGKFSYLDGESWRTFGIYTDESRQITEHIVDSEPEIIAAGMRDGDSFRGVVGQPGNFINTIVALNKAIVASHMGAGKKAIFTGVNLDAIPDEGEVGIDLTKKMGTKIYVSDVIWNKAKIGALTFMAV
jgi:hypothetical protein